MGDVEKILASMTLKQKIDFCTGADFWHTKPIRNMGVDPIKMSDGPHGVRCQGDDADMLGINESLPATCFPTAVTAGATFDRELYAAEGRAIGLEAREVGVSVVLGPGCNIKRNPLGGRNFEYISEDPYHSGAMAAEFIKGVQSAGASACVKHFAVNNQEYKRQSSDSIIDERTFREIYLRSFEIAIKEGRPDAVMCSYNKINGVYASDKSKLLDEILRREWGFDGVVVTDWGAMNDRIAAFRAGCDLNMPGGSRYMHKAVYNAVKSGRLDEKYVDESVKRILALVLKNRGTVEKVDRDAHHALAKKVAVEGAVLLKNDGALPISEGDDAVLIGRMAEHLRYQGCGSSHINPTRVVSMTGAMPSLPYIPCGDEIGEVSEAEIAEAVAAAKKHKIAIVALGLPEVYESEAFDREHMKLPCGYVRLYKAVSEVNENTVLVLFGGGAMELPEAERINAILYMGLPGQAGGEAVSDLLYGRENPSGRLGESWPLSYDDVISSETFGTAAVEYLEGIYVGYRYYDKANLSVRYPFGHGLSYTNFEYSELEANKDEVSFTVENIGERRGAEVVQLYISPPNEGTYRSVKELVGFDRVELDVGESRKISISLDSRAFAVYRDGFRVERGIYKILVGASSRDIRLCADIEIDGEERARECDADWYASPCDRPSVADWEKMSGMKSQTDRRVRKRDFTLSYTISEMRERSLFMKLVSFGASFVLKAKFGFKKYKKDPTYRMMLTSVLECPIRAMEICSGGALSEPLARLLVFIAKII